MWNLIICDDEPAIIKKLEEKLQRCKGMDAELSDIGRIFTYCDELALAEDIEEGSVEADIVIMDIKLRYDSGIHVAERILGVRPDCQIIFMSGYDDYYEAVYDVDHIYFLQKPVHDETLAKALRRAIAKLRDLKESFFCRENKSGRFVIPYRNIYYFEKQKRQVLARGHGGQILCSFYGKFDEMEELPKTFLRCHNSMIVNLGRIKAIERNKFVLIDGETVPISRKYLPESRLGFARYRMPEER